MQYIEISDTVAIHILSKHDVTIEEVIEVFFNSEEPPLIKRSTKGGKRYLAQGRTEAGRYLIIAFERKQHESIAVVTARDMNERERQWYREKGK
ncbi:BrnT family toxin [Candidatus Poribacteria bacterium]|nr:BrnT family toxin [Candidatus Poribacteria bacterium]